MALSKNYIGVPSYFLAINTNDKANSVPTPLLGFNPLA